MLAKISFLKSQKKFNPNYRDKQENIDNHLRLDSEDWNLNIDNRRRTSIQALHRNRTKIGIRRNTG